MLIAEYSSGAHQRQTRFRFFSWLATPGGVSRSCMAHHSCNGVVSTGSGVRSARPNALRAMARSTHSARGCNQAPLPGSPPRSSTTTCHRGGGPPAVCATRCTSADRSSRARQPTHVRRPACSGFRGDGGEPSGGKSTAGFTPGRRRFPPRHPGRPVRCRDGCRSASRSTSLRAGRSGLPCRSRATAGSRARSPAPPSRPGR